MLGSSRPFTRQLSRPFKSLGIWSAALSVEDLAGGSLARGGQSGECERYREFCAGPHPLLLCSIPLSSLLSLSLSRACSCSRFLSRSLPPPSPALSLSRALSFPLSGSGSLLSSVVAMSSVSVLAGAHHLAIFEGHTVGTVGRGEGGSRSESGHVESRKNYQDYEFRRKMAL